MKPPEDPRGCASWAAYISEAPTHGAAVARIAQAVAAGIGLDELVRLADALAVEPIFAPTDDPATT